MNDYVAMDRAGMHEVPGVGLPGLELDDMAGNAEKLRAAFAGALGIDPAIVHDELAYDSIPEWDSVGHMSFVTEVETLFGIMLDTDDIIDMSSYRAVRRILQRYGVRLPD